MTPEFSANNINNVLSWSYEYCMCSVLFIPALNTEYTELTLKRGILFSMITLSF